MLECNEKLKNGKKRKTKSERKKKKKQTKRVKRMKTKSTKINGWKWQQLGVVDSTATNVY